MDFLQNCHADHMNMTSSHTEWEKNTVGVKSTTHNLAGAKARARGRHLTQGSCEAAVGTEEQQLAPGWDSTSVARVGGLRAVTIQMRPAQSRLIGLCR